MTASPNPFHGPGCSVDRDDTRFQFEVQIYGDPILPLVRDYERRIDVSEAFIYVAMGSILLRRAVCLVV